MVTQLALLYVVLIASELIHVFMHGRVLLAVGTVMREAWYYKGRGYFFYDVGSPIAGALLLLVDMRVNPDRAAWPLLAFTLFLVAGHVVIHAVYITAWKARKAWVGSIIHWASIGSNRERVQEFGWFRHARNAIGTSHDIVTHLALIWVLSRNLFARS